MPQHVLDDLQVGSTRQGQGGCTVAQVVEPDRRQPSACRESHEVSADVVGVQRGAVFAGEHQPGVGPGIAPGSALGRLAFPVGAQRGDGQRV